MVCSRTKTPVLTDQAGLQGLFDHLQSLGWNLIGPRVRNGTVHFETFRQCHELPVGWHDVQERGSYRLEKGDAPTLFGILHGAESAKRFLFPPQQPIWRAIRVGGSLQIIPTPPDKTLVALIGLRPCDLHAIAIHDNVFLNGFARDPLYAARREHTLLVAVNCTRAHATCFCRAVGGGPRAEEGFDLALTEWVGESVRYLIEPGSERGEEILSALHLPHASERDIATAKGLTEQAAEGMPAPWDDAALHDLIIGNAESARWKQTDRRCFACGNCTQVCPTCFCHTFHDPSSLDGAESAKVRQWDSCFLREFTHVHGGAVRHSIASRYRQWLSHKFAAWQDQFGTLGCVGCGRCITWCPAQIDVREEIAGLREGELVGSGAKGVSS